MAGFKTIMNPILLAFIITFSVAHSLDVSLIAPKNPKLPAEKVTLISHYTGTTRSSLVSCTWLHNRTSLITCHTGDNCRGGKYSVIIQEGSCSLEIDNLTLNDTGTYIVFVDTFGGGNDSATAELIVSRPHATSVEPKFGPEDDKEYNVTTTKTSPGPDNTEDENDPSRIGIGIGIGIPVLIGLALVMYRFVPIKRCPCNRCSNRPSVTSVESGDEL